MAKLTLIFFLSFFYMNCSGECTNIVDKEPPSNWGKKIGVLTPATNLTLEHELWSMRVDGATIATARILVDKIEWESENDLERFVESVLKNIPNTAEQLQQVKPDSLLLGISISNLWGGLKSNEQLKLKIKNEAGLDLYTPVDAIKAALACFPEVKKIGVVTPYPKIADKKVEAFYGELGIAVVAQESLRCKSALEIGEVPEATIKEAIIKVNTKGGDTDAIMILGTDLHAAKVAAECEKELSKPIISVNASTWWFVLRQNGITTKLSGLGLLLERF